MSDADFEKAIAKAEETLGLTDQPRAIVFHEKQGRRHCHVVWSRINVQEMKAVQLSYSKQKLQTVARELFLEHGWQMPKGMAVTGNADPRNYTHAQWQQAKRAEKDVASIQTAFEDAWAISDSASAFIHALQERGYKLAKGDRRGFVAVDYKGEVYSLSRYLNIKPKKIAERIGKGDALPDVAQTKAVIAQEMLEKARHWHHEVVRQANHIQNLLLAEKQALLARQQAEHAALLKVQEQQRQMAEQQRLARLRRGLLGVLDRITGMRRKMIEQNRAEAEAARLRAVQERQQIQAQQHHARTQLKQQFNTEKEKFFAKRQDLREDAAYYKAMRTSTDTAGDTGKSPAIPSPKPDSKQEFLEKRKSQAERTMPRPARDRI